MTTNSGNRAVATRPQSSILATQIVLDRYGYTPEQKDILARQIGPGLSDAQILFGLEVAKARGLDVLKREVYLVGISGRVAIIPSIEGLRAICERSKLIDGPIDIEYCGPDGAWCELWLSDKPPSAARATGYRKDSPRPYRFVALWKEFHRTGETWNTYGTHMLGIVAERHLRKRIVPELVSELDIDAEPEDALESAAVRYMWALAREHGYEHKDVHRIFGIDDKASLQEEIDRRGMDWRTAVDFVAARIKGHGDLPGLPAAAQGGDASMLYEPAYEPEAVPETADDTAALDSAGVTCVVCGEPATAFDDDGVGVCDAHLAPAASETKETLEIPVMPASVQGVATFVSAAAELLRATREDIAKLGRLPTGAAANREAWAECWARLAQVMAQRQLV
jgi:hypothetical protein